MTPIYFSLTLSIGFWTGILVQRYYLMKRINLEILNNTFMHTAWKRDNALLEEARKEHAAAEKLVKRELRKRTKKTV